MTWPVPGAVGGLSMVALAGVVGSLSSQACGTPWSLWKAVVALGCSIALGAWVALRRAGGRSEAIERGAIVAVGGVMVLAAHSGPGLLALGGAAWILSRWPGGRRAAPEALGVGVWLALMAADVAQRGTFGEIAAVAGVSVGVLSGLTLCRTHAAPWVLGVAAHAWVAWWWWIDWLPMNAWWALVSLPLSLWAGSRPAWRSVASLVHAVTMAAAFGAVALLR